MSDVEISVPANLFGSKLALDGTDIAKHVRGFTLTHEPGRSRLTLDIPVQAVTSINAANVEVMLPPSIAGLLERAGWTPPPGTDSVLPRRADGCPCEWLKSGLGALVLGHIVPTCPVHGEPQDVHTFFGLSYANYFVAPRSLLQSMPQTWQHRFTTLMAEYEQAFSHMLLAAGYNVEAGKWVCLHDLSFEEMTRLGITCSNKAEGEHECWPGNGRCTFYDRLGEEIDQHTASVFVSGKDPVPHYDRGRTRVQRADELSEVDRG